MVKHILFSAFFLALSVCIAAENNSWSAAAHVLKYWKEYKRSPLPPKKYDAEKLEIVRNNLKKFAPYLLEECSEIDQAMQWRKDTMLSYIASGIKYPDFSAPPPHECTSWMAMPELTADGNILLHKNRDSGVRYLNALRVAVPGKFSWTGIGNRCSLYPAMGINEKGLVVVMNAGNASDNYNSSGLGTIVISRIILENCSTAQEAVEMVENIIKSGGYYHGKTGSIWFIADTGNGFIIENDAKYMEAQKLKSHTLAIRANTWRFAGMLAFSKQKTADMIGNHYREYAVRDRLFENGRKNITVSDSISAARKRTTDGGKEIYPPCGTATNSAATFVIDREFPSFLSTAYIAFGPPRHTVFIPVPVCATKLPDALLDGTFCHDAVYRGRRTGLDLPVDKYEKLEKEMFRNNSEALKTARKLLKSGDSKGAKQIVNETFERNIKLLPAKW